MSDRDVIAWARDWADQLAGARQFTQEERYRRLADLAEKGAEQAAEIARLQDALHRDRTGLAAALGKVVDEVRGRMWITEGRGPYEWDDDRYREEAGDALRKVDALAVKALRESGNLSLKALLPAPPGGER